MRTIGRMLLACALGLSLLLMPSAAVGAAPGSATQGSAPSQAVGAGMDPDDYARFSSGLEAHDRNMRGLETALDSALDQLRGYAQEMAPLIGSPDPADQLELLALAQGAATVETSQRTWAEKTPPSFTKAMNRFQRHYGPLWSKTKERRTFRAGVADMRAGFQMFFSQAVVNVVAAAGALSRQDVAGFWDLVAVAEGAEAFARDRFDRGHRRLLRMTP